MRGDEALFAFECKLAARAGDWPEQETAAPSESWLAASPIVAASYAGRLSLEGRFAEAKPLLAFAVRGFARQGAAGPLRAAIARLVDVDLHLGDVAEAETGLRFLRDEPHPTDDGGDSLPDAAFALGRGGFLVGLTEEDRLGQLEAAAIGFANADRRSRALEAAFEWKRLAAAAGSRAEGDADSAVARTLRQKAVWNSAYAQHARLFDPAAPRAPVESTIGPYYRTLAKARELRERMRADAGAGDDEVRKFVADLAARFPGDVELQAERLLLLAGLHARAGRPEEAEAELREAEALFTLGLAPEYAREIAAASAAPPGAEGGPVPVRVRCFGGFAFERAGAPIGEPRWKRKKAQELLLLLLLRPGHAMPKEHAIDALFGGDVDPEKAANQLYVAIHEVKRVMKETLGWRDAVVLRDGVLSLPEALIEEVDVEKYTTLVRVADQLQTDQPELSAELYETAAELYGPLLPNKPYLDWLDRLRDELERKQSRVLERLVRAAQQRGEPESAKRFAREWLELDPLREEALQALLRLLLGSGGASEAAGLFAAFEKRLFEELGARPSEETIRLFDASVRKM